MNNFIPTRCHEGKGMLRNVDVDGCDAKAHIDCGDGLPTASSCTKRASQHIAARPVFVLIDAATSDIVVSPPTSGARQCVAAAVCGFSSRVGEKHGIAKEVAAPEAARLLFQPPRPFEPERAKQHGRA